MNYIMNIYQVIIQARIEAMEIYTDKGVLSGSATGIVKTITLKASSLIEVAELVEGVCKNLKTTDDFDINVEAIEKAEITKMQESEIDQELLKKPEGNNKSHMINESGSIFFVHQAEKKGFLDRFANWLERFCEK